MKNWIKSMTPVALFAGLIFLSGHAVAGCGIGATGTTGTPGAAGMKPMVYRQGDAGGLLLTDFFEGAPFNTAAITGLWSFVFTAEGNTGAGAPPDNALVDAGYVVWHDDGTEIMNSGRAPVSGSFCLGVWKQVGESTYRLNHWALAWLPGYPFSPNEAPSWSSLPNGVDDAFQWVGPTNIQETITLSRGANSYSGTFVLTQYLNNGNGQPINDIKGAQVVATIKGTVSATRITVN